MATDKLPVPNIQETWADVLKHTPSAHCLEAQTLSAFCQYIKENNCKKIVVLTGAGISTNAGICDFRTPGTGLYDNLQKYKLPYPEAVFDIEYFKSRPEPFFALAKDLYPGQFKPTKCHLFLKMLQDKGLLLRNYTQNIDMLERMAGLEDKYLVEAHGSFHTARCVGPRMTLDTDSDGESGNGDSSSSNSSHVFSQPVSGCGQIADAKAVEKAIIKGEIPMCECGGLVKPDIVFFGEQLPRSYHASSSVDFDDCDALIVIGTSLTVAPFCHLVEMVGKHVPRLLINRECCAPFHMHNSDIKRIRDAVYLGDCDSGVLEFIQNMGWTTDWVQGLLEGVSIS